MLLTVSTMTQLHEHTSLSHSLAQTQATLGSSHQEMNESFSSVFAFIHEQQQLITEMFGGFNLVTDSLAFILSILQGKVSFLHALIFFVFAVYLVYEVTASKLTRRGRPWLYVVCTSNFLLEAVTVMYQQISGSDGFVSSMSGSFQNRLLSHTVI